MARWLRSQHSCWMNSGLALFIQSVRSDRHAQAGSDVTVVRKHVAGSNSCPPLVRGSPSQPAAGSHTRYSTIPRRTTPRHGLLCDTSALGARGAVAAGRQSRISRSRHGGVGGRGGGKKLAGDPRLTRAASTTLAAYGSCRGSLLVWRCNGATRPRSSCCRTNPSVSLCCGDGGGRKVARRHDRTRVRQLPRPRIKQHPFLRQDGELAADLERTAAFGRATKSADGCPCLNHTMAGYLWCKWILVQRIPHCLSAFDAEQRCERPVCRDTPRWDCTGELVDRALERSAAPKLGCRPPSPTHSRSRNDQRPRAGHSNLRFDRSVLGMPQRKVVGWAAERMQRWQSGQASALLTQIAQA